MTKRIISSVVLAVAFIPVMMAAFVTYTARMRADLSTWYYGSDHVFVGCADGGDGKWCGWDWKHEPTGYYNPSSSSTNNMEERWDFEGISCSAATDLCTATGFQLPNGVEVRLSTAGSMPVDLQSSWPSILHRKQVYYIVNSTPAAVNTATGTFGLSLTRGGSAIDITADGSNMKLTFAGWKHVIQYSAVPVDNVSINTATDVVTTTEADGTTPKAHGLSTGAKLYFVQTATNTLPTGTVAYGAGATYCVAVINTTQFYVRAMINSDASCPSTNIPPSNTGTMSCNPSGSSSQCQILTGSFMGQTMAFELTSITSGSPTNISINTPYWTLYPVSTPAPYFAFAASGQEAINEDKLVPDAPFTANFRVLYQDFTDTGSNALVYSSGFGTGGSFYIRELTGYPQGTLFSWRQLGFVRAGNFRNTTSDKFGSVDNATGAVTLVAKVPATAAPGDYPISVTFGPNASGAYTDPHTFGYTLHAVDLVPLTLANPPPSDFTALAGLSQWEQLMIDNNGGGRGSDFAGRDGTYGCASPSRDSYLDTYTKFVITNPSQNYAISVDARGQFYARRSYYDSYTYQQQAWSSTVPDQANFKNCADYLAYWYANLFDTSPSQSACCGMTGQQGLYKAYGLWRGVPGDPFGQFGEKFKQAILRTIQAGDGFITQGRSSDGGTREMAWSTDLWHIESTLNGRMLPYYRDAIDVQIMWMYELAIEGATPIFHEPFMGGLTEADLTQYYIHVHRDPRIPVVLKAYSDRHWSSWLNLATWQTYYNVYPYGERCAIGCQEYTDTKLNAFLTANNWFVWRLTGDTTYRDRGDLLFEHQFDDGTPYNMKQSNQTYYRNFEGVAWRTNRANPW